MSTLFPHPVLHTDTLDYCDPDAYSASFERISQSGESETVLQVQHRLKKDTLIATLIEQGEASFYCTVAVDRTPFRCTEEAIEVEIQQDSITARQEITLPAFKSHPDMFAMAGIRNHGAKQIPVEEAKGIDDFYKSEELAALNFSEHAMLACSNWRHIYHVGTLFRIQVDEDMTGGTFRAEACYQPLRITISMSRTLFGAVESNNEAIRAHVLCASLVPMLKELREKHRKCNEGGDVDTVDVTDLEAAEGLKNYFKSQKIPTWEDSEFNPVKAASQFKPAVLDGYLMENL